MAGKKPVRFTDGNSRSIIKGALAAYEEHGTSPYIETYARPEILGQALFESLSTRPPKRQRQQRTKNVRRALQTHGLSRAMASLVSLLIARHFRRLRSRGIHIQSSDDLAQYALRGWYSHKRRTP